MTRQENDIVRTGKRLRFSVRESTSRSMRSTTSRAVDCPAVSSRSVRKLPVGRRRDDGGGGRGEEEDCYFAAKSIKSLLNEGRRARLLRCALPSVRSM